jgi:hypothetical protein
LAGRGSGKGHTESDDDFELPVLDFCFLADLGADEVENSQAF